MARINSAYQIGDFDAVINLQQFTSILDEDSGTYEDTWATDSSPWAKIDYTAGVVTSEDVAGGVERVSYRVDFVIRGVDDPGVTEKWRVNYDSKNYDIETVVVEGRNQFIRLVTEYKEE